MTSQQSQAHQLLVHPIHSNTLVSASMVQEVWELLLCMRHCCEDLATNDINNSSIPTSPPSSHWLLDCMGDKTNEMQGAVAKTAQLVHTKCCLCLTLFPG